MGAVKQLVKSMLCSTFFPVLPTPAALQKFPHIQCFAMPHLVAVCISVFTSLLAMGAWAAAADGAPPVRTAVPSAAACRHAWSEGLAP